MILRNQKIVVGNQVPKKLYMTSAYTHVASTMENKNKSHIFNGMGDEICRYQLARTLAAEGLRKLLSDLENKKAYLALTEEKCGTTMKDFHTKTEKGLTITVERLENRFVKLIRKFTTINEVQSRINK